MARISTIGMRKRNRRIHSVAATELRRFCPWFFDPGRPIDGDAMWLSAVEIKARINRLSQLEELDVLFAFSLFWSRAIYTEAYVAHDSWRSILIPTKEGTPYVEKAKTICPDVPEADLHQALYCIFSHHALFLIG